MWAWQAYRKRNEGATLTKALSDEPTLPVAVAEYLPLASVAPNGGVATGPAGGGGGGGGGAFDIGVTLRDLDFKPSTIAAFHREQVRADVTMQLLFEALCRTQISKAHPRLWMWHGA